LGLGAALIGFGAALWRLWPPSTFVLAASSLVALVVYGLAYGRVEQENLADRS
jgi:hypothetical protein